MRALDKGTQTTKICRISFLAFDPLVALIVVVYSAMWSLRLYKISCEASGHHCQD